MYIGIIDICVTSRPVVKMKMIRQAAEDGSQPVHRLQDEKGWGCEETVLLAGAGAVVLSGLVTTPGPLNFMRWLLVTGHWLPVSYYM